MDAATSQSVSTQRLLEGLPLAGLGLRHRSRGRRIELIDRQARVVASVSVRVGVEELGSLCGAMLELAREVGRREALTAVRARLDRTSERRQC